MKTMKITTIAMIWFLSTSAMGKTIFEFWATQGDGAVALAKGDMDRDGDEDLVFLLAESGKLILLKNNGGADFTASTILNLNFTDSRVGLSVTTFDADADGDVDIAYAAAAHNSISLLFNDGRGNFAP